MAEDRTFQDLLVEQKLSNVLLRQLNKEITDLDDITPIESFKHNLAEIVNERLLVKKQLEESKKQAKHEEAEAKKLFREQEKTTQNTTLTKKYTTSLLNWTKKSFLADKARAVKNYVVDEEYRKDQNARMRSYFKGLSDSIVKPFKALKNFFGALLKKGIGPFTIGRLLGLAAIFSVIKFLNSPQWDQFKEEKLIPFLSKAAEALFGENGWFNQLYTLIMGDPNDDSKKGLVGHLAYIVGSFAGLTGESGWEAIADSVKALGRLIFGGEKSKTYGKSGEDTSLLGRIFSLSNVIKVVASGLALAWLIPFLGPVAGISIVALAAAFGFDKIREAFIALRDVIEEMTGVEGVGSWAIAGGLALGALYAFNKALMFGIRSLNPFAGAGGALRAGAGGAMTASNIKAGALDTSTLKKGQKIQLKSGGTAIWRGSQFTSGETGKILATKDVMAQAKLPGKGVMGRLMQVSKFLGQIPYLKTLFTGGMILHALMSGKPVEKMIPDIAGVFGGVGTAMLGALLGGLAPLHLYLPYLVVDLVISWEMQLQQHLLNGCWENQLMRFQNGQDLINC